MGDGAPRALGNAVSATLADADIERIAGAALRALPAPGFIKDSVREELVQALRAEAEQYRPLPYVEGEQRKAHYAPGRARGSKSITHHLTIMARYRAIDLLRIRSREAAHTVSLEALREGGATASVDRAQDGGYGAVDFWDAVDRALTEEQSRLLGLLLTGASQAEIARSLGLDRRLLFKRVKKLRAILAGALFGVVDV